MKSETLTKLPYNDAILQITLAYIYLIVLFIDLIVSLHKDVNVLKLITKRQNHSLTLTVTQMNGLDMVMSRFCIAPIKGHTQTDTQTKLNHYLLAYRRGERNLYLVEPNEKVIFEIQHVCPE